MAKITAEFLKSKGIADDVAQEILSSVSSDYIENEVVKKDYVSKALYDNEVKKVSNYDKALKEIQKIVGADDETGIANKIGELKTAISTQDKEHKAELKRVERSHADEKILSESGAINMKAITPFLTEIDANVDIETYTKMRKTQIETLIKGEDTKFLFKANEQQQNNQFAGANLADKHNQGADGQNLTLEQQMMLANQNQQ